MNKRLKQKLDYHYSVFDKTKIEPDPLQFLHRYSAPEDIELVGFLSSLFAYGNVRQIINTLETITARLGENPLNYLLESNIKELSKKFSGLYHRFYSNEDIITILIVLKNIYRNYGLLKKLFLSEYKVDSVNLKNEISLFSRYLINIALEEGRDVTPRSKIHGS